MLTIGNILPFTWNTKYYRKKRWGLGRSGKNRHASQYELYHLSCGLDINGMFSPLFLSTFMLLSHFALCFLVDYWYLTLFKLGCIYSLNYFTRKKLNICKSNLKKQYRISCHHQDLLPFVPYLPTYMYMF